MSKFRLGYVCTVGAILGFGSLACRPSAAPSSETQTVRAALNASPKTSDFVIEATNSVRLQTGGMVVNGGDIGARGTGSGPFIADGVAVDALTGVQVQTTHNIIADSVNLGTGAAVGDVQTNRLVSGTGATHGTVSGLVALPAIPTAAAVSAGTTAITVATGATVSSMPGHYGAVSVGTGSTWKLAAGSYDIASLTMSSSAKLQALGAVQIHVAGRVSTTSGAIIGPASGVTLTASGIRIEVDGINGTSGALTATPPAASFGTGNHVNALLLVPNGTLVFGTGAIATGAFMARDVDIAGSGTQIVFQDGFASAATCTAQSCNDSNPCTTDTCNANGTCMHAPVASGTSCSDGNACNGSETCDGAGACKAGTAVTCTAQDQCHTAGTCDPSTGACTNPAKANGTSCNDGNACTQTDTCQSGACTGASPVTCTAQDQCHGAGTCNPSTGACSNPALANGTACNDGNACTQTDSCQAGMCTGANPVVCTAQDQCHGAGTCNPSTGTCSNPALANGTTCNDGNACTQSDTCQAGACTGANPVTCVAADQCHGAGTCNPSTGACSNPALANGTACNDGNACTQTDTCQSGVCAGTNPVTCAAQDQCHGAGTCNPNTGACSTPPLADGTGCNDNNACTNNDVCHAGACSGSTVACSSPDQCHSGGTCDPATGACSHPAVVDGTPCDDGNSCTTNDLCAAGACTGSSGGSCSVADLAFTNTETTQSLSQAVGLSSVMTDRPDLGPGGQTVVSATVSDQGVAFFMQGLLTAENVAAQAVTLADTGSVRMELFSASQNQWTAVANLDFGPFGTTSAGTPPNSSWNMFSRTFGDPGVTATGFSAPGTTIAPGATATWFYSYFALLPLSSATQLVQAAQMGSVRLSINLSEAGNPSVPLVSAVDLTSSFASTSVAPLSAIAVSATLDSGPAVTLSPSAPLTDGQADAVFTGTLTAATLNPRAAFDDDGTYIQYLLAQAALSHRVSVSSTLPGGTPSSTNLTVSSSVPVVDFGLQPPPPIVSGAATHFDLQFRNDGTGAAGPISLGYAIAGTPAGSTVAPPDLAPGATGTGSVDFTAPSAAPLNDQLTVTWQDRDGNLYGPLTRTSQSCPIGSCSSVVPAQVASQQLTSSDFGRHLSVVASSNVPTAVPGDLVTFSATITNDGIEVPGLTDTVSVTNTGFTPFVVQGYEQDLQYLSVASNEWVTVATHTVDSTGAVTGDPSLAQIGTGGGIPIDAPGVVYSSDPIVGTTIDPGARASWNLFVGNTLLPPDVFKVIQDPAQSAGVRTTFRFDGIGDVAPLAAVTDLSAPFAAASSALGPAGVNLFYPGYQADGSSVTEVPFPAPADSAPLALGSSRTFTLTLPMYAGIVRGAASSDDDYLISLEYSTEPGNRPSIEAFETGPIGAFAITSVAFHRVVPIVSASKNGPAQGNAGLPQTYSVTLTNSGAVDALGVSATDAVDGEPVTGATFATLTVPAGATRTGALKAPTPLDRPPGAMTDVATVSWQDKNGNLYGPISSSFTMNVLPAHPEGYLSLSSSGTPIQTRGTAATVTATATTSVGTPVAGLAVHVTVSGANAQGLDLVTGTDGTASFSYDGPNLGGDSLTAAATISGPPVQSAPLQLTWVSSVGTPCTGRATPLDVVIVIDGSPSMFTDDQIEMAQSATDALINDLDFTRDQVSGILFSGGADVYAQLGSDGAQAAAQINQGIFDYVHACDGFCAGGTNFPAALEAALAELQSSRHRPGATPLMIFLSDGGNTGSDPTADIAAVKAAGIRAVAIGYGPSVNAPLMLKIASSSNDYFLAPSIRELNWAIANVVGDACRTLPPLVSAGPSQTGYEVRIPGVLTLQGEAHGAGPQGNQGLTTTWTQVSGPAPAIFVDPSSPTTSVLFSQPGTYVFQLETSDGVLTTASTTTVTVDPDPSIVGASLAVALASPGPLTTGTSETATATLVDGNGVPISHYTVQFTVAGANAGAVTVLTNAAGVATFTYAGANAGTDTLHATALGSTLQVDSPSVSVQWTPPAGAPAVVTQGWIGSPASQSTVMGLVPITVGAGVTLAAASVSYWPAKSPDDVHVLAADASGGPGATLATLDTTGLQNGGYVIDVQGTDSDGHTQESAVLVTVAGDYKPGRLVIEVPEFTVPVAGIPISVGRRYDSLTKDKVGDFGNGWSLTVGHPDLEVGPTHDVTITLPNGRRVTFFLTPFQYPFPFKSLYQPLYTPEAGVFGSLTGDGCPLIVPNGGQIVCFEEADAEYRPTTYKYTDPYGTVYTMGADGSLKSIQDRTNNVINFTADGISSPVSGQTVSLTRDAQGRITKILTPNMGDFFQTRFEYDYTYDAAGNLATAQAPNQNVYSQITQYTYDGTHRLLNTTDPAGHHARTSTFDDEGRLASDTDAMGNVTTYAYDVAAHKTTTTYPDTGVLSQTFDDRGLLLSQTDQLGRTTTHQYDANRNETKRTNALGEATTYTYDANGNQTSVTNARGESTTTTYNAFSEPSVTTNPIGNTTTISYDVNGLPTNVADSMGPVAAFTASDRGLPLTVTDAVGNTVFMNYDTAGNLAGRLDRLGRFTNYQYDQMGRMTSMTDPRGGTTTYTYDNDGDLLTNIDPLGFGPLRHYEANRNLGEIATTTQYVGVNVAIARGELYSYDANNHLATILHESDGAQIHQTWDFRGNLLTKTDEAGHTTSNAYDLAGQLVQTTYADGTFTTQTYDAIGRLASKTDERGHRTSYGYQPGCDCSDRMTSVTDALGRTTSMAYDGMGRRTSTTDANGHQTSYLYDLRGHVIETDYADGTATRDAFDLLGRRIASTDQTNATTLFGYDAEGQLTSVTDPLGHVTSYGYDANGNLTSVTDANHHTTTYAYDAANRKVSRTLPLGMTETFGYDSDRNETSHTDFRGRTSSYGFDNRRPGRAISKAPDPSLGEPSVTYTYNVDNTRASMTDASGTTTYTYDVRDRMITKVTPEGALTYTYDPSGNVATIDSSNANGTSVSYAWDAANQLVSVTDNRLGGITTAGYTRTGRQASLTHPNGVGVTYGYDPLDRVLSMAWRKGTAPALASWDYTYSARGQRLSATDLAGREAAYRYDAASRLMSETVTGDPSSPSSNGAVTYALDAAGNRLTRSSTLAALDGQSLSVDENDQLVGDSYDLNGNTIGSDGHTYGYDFENRLLSKDGGAVTIVYDGDGYRVRKNAGGVATEYLIDELNPTGYRQVAEERSSGSVQVRYTYGSVIVSQARIRAGTATTSFYGYDAHGNVSFLTDADGSQTDSYVCEAWGDETRRTGVTESSRRYVGEEEDPDLELVYLRARYYDPKRGRFYTSDSGEGDLSRPITLNRYLYGNADPVEQKDPDGRAAAAEQGLDLSIATRVIEGIGLGVLGAAGNKTSCNMQDAADGIAAVEGEDVVSINPKCPKITCDCVGDVEPSARDLFRIDRDIPQRIKARGQGRTQASATVRCFKNLRERLRNHPANKAKTLKVINPEITVCFPSP